MTPTNPQEEAPDKVDQFPLRLPPGMRDHIKEAAKENSRSMNAEIVERLQGHADIDLYRQVLASSRFENEQFRSALAAREADLKALEGEVQALRTRNEALMNEGRAEAERRLHMLDEMWKLLSGMDEAHKANAEDLQEVAALARYLQADQFAMQFELFPDPDAPAGFNPAADAPAPMKTFIGQQLAEYIDLRMLRIARLVRDLTPMAARAKVMSHHVRLSDEEREVARLIMAEDPSADEANEFYDFVIETSSAASDEYQAAIRGALNTMMPKFFPDWSSNDGAMF